MSAGSIQYALMPSPLGELLLTAKAGALTSLLMHPPKPRAEWEHAPQSLAPIRRQLEAFFAGERKHFELPLAPEGTPFQQIVWRALQEIPYGTTVTYGEIARRIGAPDASRAVGLANGRNPIAIVIPCHRVIGASGKLTGYGGGLPNKAWLLDFERAHAGMAAPRQAALPFAARRSRT